ncbi:PucR family transcriptional regulator ligand-binding domain-containing protein [Alicyclobacillus tolerans]|uniref:PucR family transcriptional regulator n=1 Tax=Alicyclobacillus tolerans TaxID=90970 RepID=UPI001F44FD85|nr:PucR family transcriptional regulator [Alicyclobacillus tolerans]MCF8565329.1 PucR family transcriptional regulator ligand-binding domain-containing protein [Alicyclobacillus tolerans]
MERMNGPIRVADLLARPVFQKAQLAAGKDGLDREVRWVHILDVSNVGSLIHGRELVLTTGIGFGASVEGFRAYLQQLIDAGASGLCIELGDNIAGIPQPILALADSSHFPLIVFPTEVRFVDITQDAHGLILSRHHKLLDDLEQVARELQRFTVHTGSVKRMLAFLEQVVGAPVLYGRFGHPPITVDSRRTLPPLDDAWLSELSIPDPLLSQSVVELPKHWQQDSTDKRVLVVQPVVVLGMTRGVFGFVSDPDTVGEYLLLILDKAVSALAQDEFHRLALVERQLFFEQDLVEQMVRGETNVLPYKVELQGDRREHGSAMRSKGVPQYCVAVISAALIPPNLHESNDEEWFTLRTELSMTARLAFQSQELRPYVAIRGQRIVVVVESPAKSLGKDPTPQVKRAIQHLQEALRQSGTQMTQHVPAGIGQAAKDPGSIKQSYEEALLALYIAERSLDSEGFHLSRQEPGSAQSAVQTGAGNIVAFQEAGIYRWFALFQPEQGSFHLADSDLATVVAYDQKHQTNLLQTLKTYLDCNMSKQQTADALYIHRQTLYHRLEQIEKLLPVDLRDPKSRLSVHVSLYYHEQKQNQRPSRS